MSIAFTVYRMANQLPNLLWLDTVCFQRLIDSEGEECELQMTVSGIRRPIIGQFLEPPFQAQPRRIKYGEWLSFAVVLE